MNIEMHRGSIAPASLKDFVFNKALLDVQPYQVISCRRQTPSDTVVQKVCHLNNLTQRTLRQVCLNRPDVLRLTKTQCDSILACPASRHPPIRVATKDGGAIGDRVSYRWVSGGWAGKEGNPSWESNFNRNHSDYQHGNLKSHNIIAVEVDLCPVESKRAVAGKM
jgi:hypothetical protein